ncbi:MAG: UDP-N-acetylmuramoyl-tripeptide--D-alanyl-D-alanine ligase [Oscillibacter sp.]|nr:UDP-N-acetylmuramoyl-tripeptide--D-alanyl-D-alanine ligase [Oscillibacter sp.]
MQPMTVKEIEHAVCGVWWNPQEGLPSVSVVSTDSRKIEKNCLFVPLTGENFDGHNYIDAALDSGAAGVLCAKLPKDLRADKFYIKVDDTRLALKALAKVYREKFDIPFVQITGSVGKTTTKEMIAAVLSAKFKVLKTPENYNNDVGTPLTLLSLTGEEQVAVIETGMNHFGEIRYLGEMVQPDIAVISNIGDAHIEFLGSREGILKAKSEIFENLRPGGVAILNGDDALLNTLELPCTTERCGQSEHCGVRIGEVADHGLGGVTCHVQTEKETYELVINAPGEHLVYSASMAVAIGEKLGMNKEEIERGVASFQGVGSRMEVVRLPGGRIILNDCYNANPQSVSAGLEVLAKSDAARKIAILGDMGELGDLTEQAHYNIGTLAAMLGIDQVIAIGQKASKLAEGVRDSGGSVSYFPEKSAAEEELRKQFGPGTVALVKASHFSMHFETIVEFLKNQEYTE